MQNNVNATNTLTSAVLNFGDERVQTCDGGVIKVTMKEVRNGDLLTLSNLLQWADVQIKRSGSGLLILLIPKSDGAPYSEDLLFHISQIEFNANNVPEGEESNKTADPISKSDEFRESAAPLMDFLSHNYNSNVYATVDASEAMLIESLKTIRR